MRRAGVLGRRHRACRERRVWFGVDDVRLVIKMVVWTGEMITTSIISAAFGKKQNRFGKNLA